jgi:hypothetical protein
MGFMSMAPNVMEKRDTNIVGKKMARSVGSKRYLTCDFSGLEAGSADILTLGIAIDQCANALNIWVPATTGTTV